MDFKHEIITSNKDISVKFQYSEDTGSIVSKHWHRSLEIIYLLSGTLEVNINGLNYSLSENDLILINPLEIHSTVCTTGNTALLLQIPYEFCNTYIPDIYTIKFICTPNIKEAEKILYLNDLKATLFDFYTTYNKKEYGYILKINSLLFNLLFILLNKFSIKDKKFDIKKTDKYINRLDLAIDYIKKHYAEQITLDSISQMLYLNPEYFSRFFKKYMGISFLKYVNLIRLEHAYIEILNTDNTISEIAGHNGFRNHKFFIKLFKANYSCSPSEKRRQNKKTK